MTTVQDNGGEGHQILLLDPSARAGRTGHRFKVTEAKDVRMSARWALGNSRDDLPTTLDLLDAARAISALLFDATEGDARLMVELGGEHHSPSVVASTLRLR